MKKICIVFFILVANIAVKAQQDAIYSQYMFNPFMINPAYAGSREALSGVLLFREQWVGIDGAPRTQTFSVHSAIGKTGLAGGLNLVNDVVGPTRNSGAFATAAYHLKLSKGKLSFGLRGGMYNSRLDNAKLNYYDNTDRFINQGIANATIPSFDAGLYYYTKMFYAGLSSTHLTQQKFAYDNYPSGTNLYLRRHYMLSTGMAFEVSPKVVLKPSALVKFVEASPVNIDVNFSALLNKRFWLGISSRNGNGFNNIAFISEFYITDWARLGYSYDLVLNRLKKFTMGTHEIVAAFDINVKRVKYLSPRYL
jgi:type IX secretion system PorP/SprF family membrane protein